MGQIGKMVLHVLKTRLKRKIEEKLSQDQYGFRSGKGTTNVIFALNMTFERAVRNRRIFICVL